jgi:hypothetical protein
MRLRSSVRTLGLAFALAGALTTNHLSAVVLDFFDGAGYGPTAEYAVQAAIWDAEASASAYGLYRCELVGEPTVFQQPPNSRRAFRAQATLSCEP